MNYKKIGIGLGVLAVILAIGITTVSAAQNHGRGLRGLKTEPENKDQVVQAIENSDYQTWKSLVGDKSRLAKVITEENFSQLVQMHNLAQEGEFDEAKEIAEELGLGQFSKGLIKGGPGPRLADKNGDGWCDGLDKQ
ncbi:MAG: hypothetical protein A3A02_03185 [Candidatus Buchananbacteria bacterium RIFCSPLOWO2_01_FULL_39_33]|uniref:Uncharacterized protein n=1 Tax=Candidatus Buchananbacteria bacterium RIFCSPLOWO2_01_FULL_39_33 TaxID=1797543 RepID=A0A1G1YLK0_9BACT|nr:MAG: hypothetical protein A2820_00600 [Candidatus Buchananbacteria bacterium RIFCSPHIGHO2_01_FULL_40_35]OGY53232.1 MAG: hypothetical protein A3A02_03185 [Candidatus Buchananbacteria bacterium RIFCSPLOWO2_01_FULL_39_33]